MKRLICLIGLSGSLFASFPLSPQEFLGYKLGEKFTYHHQVIDYFEQVANATDHVQLLHYGDTYEKRPLIIAVVTHPENTQTLEQIRTDHLINSGLISGNTSSKKFAIVWLSYSVHGNESSSTEAAMRTLFAFSNTSNKTTMEWLKRTVVIIDPCINPDGRDRYVQFYTMTGNREPNVSPHTREHQEPWPGGRTNHYYFDLNRDWTWQTQIETIHRIPIYKAWMPHIHVDYHEQYINEPYYFAPAAEPFHERITPWQREFQTIIGKNHTRYFDEKNWLYFTKEVFDLLYPGYGDTYPIYNGAMGMTYEKAGGALGGLAVRTSDGDTLTLRSRIDHHYVTGLSTVESAYKHRDRIINEFKDFFSTGENNPSGRYKAYVMQGSNTDAKLNDLLDWLDFNGIEYGLPEDPRSRSLRGFSYRTGKNESFKLDGEDIIISTAQKRSVLTNVLFEPNTIYTDSLTYDLTAWSIPYVYGLDAFAVETPIKIKSDSDRKKIEKKYVWDTKPYAYLNKWESIHDLKFLADILKKKVVVRSAEESFKIKKIFYDRGSLVITRRGNEHLGGQFDKIVRRAAKKYNTDLTTVGTGLVTEGKDFGSGKMRVVKAPRIAVLSGDQVSSRNFGEIWHFFEQQIEYPISVLNASKVSSFPYKEIDVIIMPEGNYRSFVTEIIASEQIKKQTSATKLIKNQIPGKLLDWVKDGGRLIVIGSAMDKFVDQKGYGLVKYESKEAKKIIEKKAQEKKLSDRLTKYKDRDRKKLIDNVYGSIIKIKLDDSHPLAFGYDKDYFSLKQRSKMYPYLPKGWNVGTLENSDAHVAGFMGHRIKKEMKNKIIFGVQDVKKGRIVYLADNPLFRAFWYNGKLLFGNAVFIVGG